MRAERLASILLLCLSVVAGANGGTRAVHVWPFDEGTGDQAIDVIGDCSGRVEGAAWVPGRLGRALQFDGFDDHVALPDNNPVWLPTDDFTISFWVCFKRDKGASVAENEVLVDLNAGSGSDPENELGYIVFRHGENGTIAFQMATMRNTDEDLESQLVPVRDRWYHIAAVRQGTLQAIYIDGQMDAWRVCSYSPIDFVGGYDDDKINVGRYTTTVGWPRYYFKGLLDELMVFDTALAPEEIDRLCRDGVVTNDLYVDAVCGDDWGDGRCPATAFATIRKAVDAAQVGDTLNLMPGVYRESISFQGKAITIQSAGDAAILESPEGTAVSFSQQEGNGSVLRNVVLRNSQIAIGLADSSPTIFNVTVTGNVLGVEAYGSSNPRIGNSIFWDNAEGDLYGCATTYSCIERPSPGAGNFSEDPLFVDPEKGDYHLCSRGGRYGAQQGVWIPDEVTSPCIDAGDPAADFSCEPEPNGDRLNVGAHGGTAYAERSEPRI
jgi:hypothetical protein